MQEGKFRVKLPKVVKEKVFLGWIPSKQSSCRAPAREGWAVTWLCFGFWEFDFFFHSLSTYLPVFSSIFMIRNTWYSHEVLKHILFFLFCFSHFLHSIKLFQICYIKLSLASQLSRFQVFRSVFLSHSVTPVINAMSTVLQERAGVNVYIQKATFKGNPAFNSGFQKSSWSCLKHWEFS